jgi:hypothetical protein
LKDVHNPLFKTSSEFVWFDDNYYSTDAFSDKPKGLKPEINISTFWRPKKS